MAIDLIDWKTDEIEYAANVVAEYLLDMYKDDKQMQEAPKRFFKSAFQAMFDQLQIGA